MIIESLELRNFRNYGELELSLHPGTNLLYGDNAQGKTNILEAVYLCASAKSYRGSRDREMIRFGEEEAHVKLNAVKEEIPCRIDIHLKKSSAKGIAVNGVPIRRASELFGTVNMVLFSPEDLNIIKNGPADRRRFLDLELCQLNRAYIFSLLSYNRALVQRNRLLKDISFEPSLADTLDVWDAQLLKYGGELMRARERFLSELDPVVSSIYAGITGDAEKIRISYEQNVSEALFGETLKKSRAQDLRQGTTSAGPHRDDIAFFLENPSLPGKRGMDLRKFGSQGQQRTAALALKLSEIELKRRVTGDDPILLLDDVLSELDTDRQRHLLREIAKTQTILTSTGMENLLNSDFQIDRKFQVIRGSVTEA